MLVELVGRKERPTGNTAFACKRVFFKLVPIITNLRPGSLLDVLVQRPLPPFFPRSRRDEIIPTAAASSESDFLGILHSSACSQYTVSTGLS